MECLTFKSTNLNAVPVQITDTTTHWTKDSNLEAMNEFELNKAPKQSIKPIKLNKQQIQQMQQQNEGILSLFTQFCLRKRFENKPEPCRNNQ